MIKKQLCIMLVTALLICIFPLNASAKSPVDLSRVKFSSGSEPLVFKFGNLSMNGKLEQVYPFTEDEINKIVNETLKEEKLTELDIAEAQKKVEKAKKANEFTKEDYERIKNNIFMSMDVVPAASQVSTVLKDIDKYMNSSSWDDIGTTSVDVLEGSMTDWIKDTASGYIDNTGEIGEKFNTAVSHTGNLIAVAGFCEMLVNEHEITKQKWKDIAEGANAKRLLNDFYYKLQYKIDDHKRVSNEAGWRINFDQTMAGRNLTFFGVDSNYQTWTLFMRLNQTEKAELGSAAGRYEGFFNITARNELREFRSRAHEAIKNMGSFGEAIKKMENTPGGNVTLSTSSEGTARISRTIDGTAEAIIDKAGNITFSMNAEQDGTLVEISGITVDLNYSIGNSTNFKGGGKMSFTLSANKEEITIEGGSNKMFLTLPSSEKFSHTINASGSINAGWDKSIWKSWDGTEKTLKHAGK
ncbi:MAG TPA: hypothetical protein VHT96_14315 [Clostridia bacterium]|nr:hypothetical protein [Clostridia bacterium]